MSFRFNKTLKEKRDPLDEILGNNPRLKGSLIREDLKLKASFEEKSPSKAGMAVARWKGLALIAGPLCCYLAFKILTYSDPIQRLSVQTTENEMREKEKQALES